MHQKAKGYPREKPSPLLEVSVIGQNLSTLPKMHNRPHPFTLTMSFCLIFTLCSDRHMYSGLTKLDTPLTLCRSITSLIYLHTHTHTHTHRHTHTYTHLVSRGGIKLTDMFKDTRGNPISRGWSTRSGCDTGWAWVSGCG